MAAIKPLTTEAIALTEKKMDMTLDEIIKMSKKTTTKEKRPPRPPVKSQGFLNGSASRRNSVIQRFMDSRSSIRQGVLAQRRSNFRGNQFPVTTNVAKKAAVMPIRNVMVNRNKQRVAPALVQRKASEVDSTGKDKMVLPKQRPQTMDALFANMKQQRMRVFSAQQPTIHANSRQTSQRLRAQQQQQRRGGRGGAAPGHWFGKSAK
ncbi:uncharacterized protein M6B38_262515 [Iris pallida]|uniref:Uncharacterized protein n=1 Tax=Iris pallida TaxID=29817 RepID=A0AAX6ID73_IRIPA|nr:Uncharacterized protein M6B38_239570 [Iris pallida]KAJ6850971.1 uncharacterized protein M6B38_262515 [Iris pallida]